jgi:hypothetical protein
MHQLMDKVRFGLAKVPLACRVAVMAKVDVIAPETLQKSILRPAVVGLGDTLGAPIAAGRKQPEPGSD